MRARDGIAYLAAAFWATIVLGAAIRLVSG